MVAFLIGLSRLYLGVHYLTDVIAGYIAGIAWTDAVIIGGHLLGRRRLSRRAAQASELRPAPSARTAPG
jgi:undecaprenyl-diphosphatase